MAAASTVRMALPWYRTSDRRVWRAITIDGHRLTASFMPGSGWRGSVDLAPALWDEPPDSSGYLPTRRSAQAWAERRVTQP